MIEVAAVSKRFGRGVAVDGLSFSAPDGAIPVSSAAMAPKTTTLAIAGVITPDAGWVAIDGVDRANGAPARLGALLDHRGLYPRLTVRENVEYFARLSAVEPASVHAETDQALARLDLARSPTAGRPACRKGSA